MTHEGTVLRIGVFSMQICVPTVWDDASIVNWANAAYPSGLGPGWQIARAGSASLGDDPERVPCADRAETHVHLVLDA